MSNEITSGSWYCPLYEKDISEGLCLDINYERLGYFKDDTIKGIIKQLRKTKDEINCTCDCCPNMPLKKEG